MSFSLTLKNCTLATKNAYHFVGNWISYIVTFVVLSFSISFQQKNTTQTKKRNIKIYIYIYIEKMLFKTSKNWECDALLKMFVNEIKSLILFDP